MKVNGKIIPRKERGSLCISMVMFFMGNGRMISSKEKTALCYIKMEILFKENIGLVSESALGNIFLKMGKLSKLNGSEIYTPEGQLRIQMGIYMRERFTVLRNRGLANISILTEINSAGTGKMI